MQKVLLHLSRSTSPVKNEGRRGELPAGPRSQADHLIALSFSSEAPCSELATTERREVPDIAANGSGSRSPSLSLRWISSHRWLTGRFAMVAVSLARYSAQYKWVSCCQ